MDARFRPQNVVRLISVELQALNPYSRVIDWKIILSEHTRNLFQPLGSHDIARFNANLHQLLGYEFSNLFHRSCLRRTLVTIILLNWVTVIRKTCRPELRLRQCSNSVDHPGRNTKDFQVPLTHSKHSDLS